MGKIVLICSMLIALNISASEWESYWIAAVEDCHNEDYGSAEQNFNRTISLLESAGDFEHPSIYADRARLYMILNQYEEALSDINKALDSNKLNGKERVKAVSVRFIARIHLGYSDGYEEDVEFLVKNFEVQVENTANYVIIRNMPQSKAFADSVTNFFIRTGICQNEDDVKMLSSDICIVKKNCQKSECHASDKQLRRDLLLAGCIKWCDDNAQSAIAWCINYPSFCLVNACNSAIVEIQNNCHTCCHHGFSEDVCAAPFGDILSVMQRILQANGCK